MLKHPLCCAAPLREAAPCGVLETANRRAAHPLTGDHVKGGMCRFFSVRRRRNSATPAAQFGCRPPPWTFHAEVPVVPGDLMCPCLVLSTRSLVMPISSHQASTGDGALATITNTNLSRNAVSLSGAGSGGERMTDADGPGNPMPFFCIGASFKSSLGPASGAFHSGNAVTINGVGPTTAAACVVRVFDPRIRCHQALTGWQLSFSAKAAPMAAGSIRRSGPSGTTAVHSPR